MKTKEEIDKDLADELAIFEANNKEKWPGFQAAMQPGGKKTREMWEDIKNHITRYDLLAMNNNLSQVQKDQLKNYFMEINALREWEKYFSAELTSGTKTYSQKISPSSTGTSAEQDNRLKKPSSGTDSKTNPEVQSSQSWKNFDISTELSIWQRILLALGTLLKNKEETEAYTKAYIEDIIKNKEKGQKTTYSSGSGPTPAVEKTDPSLTNPSLIARSRTATQSLSGMDEKSNKTTMKQSKIYTTPLDSKSSLLSQAATQEMQQKRENNRKELVEQWKEIRKLLTQDDIKTLIGPLAAEPNPIIEQEINDLRLKIERNIAKPTNPDILIKLETDINRYKDLIVPLKDQFDLLNNQPSL